MSIQANSHCCRGPSNQGWNKCKISWHPIFNYDNFPPHLYLKRGKPLKPIQSMGNRVCILVKQTPFITKWLHKININNKDKYNTHFIYTNESDDFVLLIRSITFNTMCSLDLTPVAIKCHAPPTMEM